MELLGHADKGSSENTFVSMSREVLLASVYRVLLEGCL